MNWIHCDDVGDDGGDGDDDVGDNGDDGSDGGGRDDGGDGGDVGDDDGHVHGGLRLTPRSASCLLTLCRYSAASYQTSGWKPLT